jgi:peptidoglycan hydrolase-like protein with peptidoglycan-binding domain
MGVLATSAFSAETTYIHIKAESSLKQAFSELKKYTEFLPDVNGFFLGDGKYAIALGPYEENEAKIFLRGMQSSGILPGQSYLEESTRYGDRIWHMGLPLVHESISEARLRSPNKPYSQDALPDGPASSSKRHNAPMEISPNGNLILKSGKPIVKNIARAPDEWREIQYALRWAGFYDGAIDGAFGGKTREAVSAWQGRNGFYQTGSLTNVERDELFRQHMSLLIPLGVRTVQDEKSGISIKIPTGAVTFDQYSGPFALFTSSGLVDNARIILVSQEGSLEDFKALFSQMQEIENIPANTSQVFTEDAFILIGENDLIEAYTNVRLYDGAIKGFSLLWPKGDEQRRGQVLANIMSSLKPSSDVLSTMKRDKHVKDYITETFFQEPEKSSSGFFVDEKGHILTTDTAVTECGRVTFNGKYDVRVVATDPEAGFAVVASKQSLVPNNFARFRESLSGRIQDIPLTPYAFEEIVPEVSLTFGQRAGLSSLQSKLDFERVATRLGERDIGGPVLDEDGSVLGLMTLPNGADTGFFEDIGLIADFSTLVPILEQAGVDYQIAQAGPFVSLDEKLDLRREITVMINCWD